MNLGHDNTEDFVLEVEKKLKKFKENCLVSGHVDSKDPRELLSQNSLWLIQRVLFYSISMNEAVLDLVRCKNVLPIIHLVRANFEAAGILANLNLKLSKFYLEKTDFDTLESLVRRYTLGSKGAKPQGAPEPINIMNGIDAADKWFREESLKSGISVDSSIFRETYDFLSEFAHPNFHGMSLSANFNKGILKRATFEEVHSKHSVSLARYLVMSNLVIDHFYFRCFDFLITNEKLPIITE